METALIICNGEINNYEHHLKYFKDAYLICVDGGARHLKIFNKQPDLLIGDFDSISETDYLYYKNSKVEILKYPKKKDKTDTHIAIDYAIEKNLKKIIIIGAIGSRIDHTLGNIYLLRYILKKGGFGIIANEKNEIMIIDNQINIEADDNYKLSLIAATEEVSGIVTKGLYYELNDSIIKQGQSVGISNEFTDKNAKISVKSGLLFVIKSRD